MYPTLWALALLMGCGNTGQSGLVPVLYQHLTAPAPTPAPSAADLRAALTPAALEEIGRPVIIAEVPAIGGAAVLVAVATQNGVTTYLSGDGSSISLRDGVIVATRGLGHDLMVADVGTLGQALAAPPQRMTRRHQYLDGENHVITEEFTCDIAGRGDVTEQCTGASITFENRYTLSGNRRITQTRQWVSPQIGWITVTFPSDAQQS